MLVIGKHSFNSVLPISKVSIDRIAWLLLLYLCLFYNFHRYILEYAHGAFVKDNYSPTPAIWKVGKYFMVLLFIILISFNAKFRKALPLKLIVFYFTLIVFFFINVVSYLLYQTISTDELEYISFSLLLSPICFMQEKHLINIRTHILEVLNKFQYVLILSNWIVIANYILYDRLPLHAYRGALLRFGGLWDDPNTLSIFSTLLVGYTLYKRKYILCMLHIINVILAVSLTGYVLLIFLFLYWALKSSQYRVFYLSAITILFLVVSTTIYVHSDFVFQLLEAKRESINQHSDLSSVKFYILPFLQPIIMHETWLLSVLINYSPFSIIVLATLLYTFLRFLLWKQFSLQGLFYILFILSSAFLPFLYMFPINFFALLFGVLYMRGVKF